MATIIIPTPLRKFTNNQARVKISESRVSDVLQQLLFNYPDLKKHLIDTDGNVATFINIFVNADDLRNLDQDQVVLSEETVISIVPAIAGGSQFPSYSSLKL
jgi:molybdopterin converting factor small subunit